jgi:RNA binding exosome subunit
MKKIILVFSVLIFSSCAELQTIAENYPQTGVSNTEIASGLRQALDMGIEKQVTKLTEENGFYGNELVRITLPPELQKVDKTLRDVGLDALADEGLKVLNRAAEEAVKEATPIFVNAVKEITFNDARNILLGQDNAATLYLTGKTKEPLYSKFNPVVTNSLEKVGATQVWSNIINRYNSLPLTNNVNPDLADYVTNQALEGVYTMIAIEEKEIREKVSARTTNLLQRVFALQDSKY